MPASRKYVLASLRRRLLLETVSAGVDVTFTEANFAVGFSSRDEANYIWQWDGTNGGIESNALTGTSGDTYDHVWDNATALPSSTQFQIRIELAFDLASASDIPGISYNQRPGVTTPWQYSEGLILTTDQFNRLEFDLALFESATRTQEMHPNQATTVVTDTEYYLQMERNGTAMNTQWGVVGSGPTLDIDWTLTGAEETELTGTGWGIMERRSGTKIATYAVKRAAMGGIGDLYTS